MREAMGEAARCFELAFSPPGSPPDGDGENTVTDCLSEASEPRAADRKSVESRTGAVTVGFRWPCCLFREQRRIPACHSSVSRPRSSNRTCGFPASGSRTRLLLKACASRKQGGGTDDAHGVVDVVDGISALPATPHAMLVLTWPSDIAFVAASGSCRALLDSSSIASVPCRSVRILEPGPLSSPGVTRVHRYYEPLRHPPWASHPK